MPLPNSRLHQRHRRNLQVELLHGFERCARTARFSSGDFGRTPLTISIGAGLKMLAIALLDDNAKVRLPAHPWPEHAAVSRRHRHC